MKRLRTFSDSNFDGERAFDHLVKESEYRSFPQLVASLTVFSHQDTVRQTDNKNLFRIVRRKEFSEIGTWDEETRVMRDDNSGAIDAFRWSNVTPRFRNSQYNHIWSNSQDPLLYTCLANICVTPAFVSKLTDTNTKIREILRYRALDLYDFWPSIEPRVKPEGYDNLIWAETLPRVADVEQTIRDKFKRLRSNRTLRCAKEIGWLFSDFHPDPTL